MNTMLNRAKLALAVLMIAAPAAAFAGEGNGEPFNLVQSQFSTPADPSQASQVQTGSGLGPVVTFSTGGVAPADGSQGEPEPLNALSSAPEIGGIWPAQPAARHD